MSTNSLCFVTGLTTFHLVCSSNGTTLILYDEDTMHTCLVTVRLELDNCTLTW